MKTLLRTTALAAALVLVSLATASAGYTTGTCHITCYNADGSVHNTDTVTSSYDECCNQILWDDCAGSAYADRSAYWTGGIPISAPVCPFP